MDIHPHPRAEVFLTNPEFRFTIRTLGGRGLAFRKLMTADQFLAARGEYVGLVRPVRVDIARVGTADVQTWDIHLTKWFGSYETPVLKA